MSADFVTRQAGSEPMQADTNPMFVDGGSTSVDIVLRQADIDPMSVDFVPRQADIDPVSVDIVPRQAGIDLRSVGIGLM